MKTHKNRFLGCTWMTLGQFFEISECNKDTDDAIEYQSYLHHDLQLRGLATDGSNEECQKRLNEHLTQEFNYGQLFLAINYVQVPVLITQTVIFS